MGSLFSQIQRPINVAAGSVTEIITGRKRKREDEEYDSSDEISSAVEQSLNTPKRKKLLTTAQYIYKALFKDERNSDVSVMALGKVWHLHRVYLCQSSYFATMFNGCWKEASENFIKIKITDPKITLDSLNIVFGSLYLDEVTLEPLTVTSVLAAATLFQLDGLIDRCIEVMTETTNAESAVSYYESACHYGVISIKKTTFNWLLINLLSLYSKHYKWLRKISIDLMYALISSPDLFVMQTEFSVYTLLRFWLYLKLHPNYELNENDISEETPFNYFEKRTDKTSFLETTEALPYVKVFKLLRLQHLFNHHIDMEFLAKDHLVPTSWMTAPLHQQWCSMLRIDQSIDNGPKECDEKTFYETCMRCGRILHEEGYQRWRWTGFNFGLDLVLITDTGTLSIRRHHRAEHERLLSLQVKRQFLIRVTVVSLNELRQVKHSETTDIKSITLEKNEEIQLLHLNKDLVYPLLISVNLLVVSPNTPTPDSTIKTLINEPASLHPNHNTAVTETIRPSSVH